MPNSFFDELKEITFMDLENWAGEKIVSRGKSYQKNGYVSDIGQTEDGKIVGWVHGTNTYATAVSIKNGIIESQCTCPYWDNCKHAVALILEFLVTLKKNHTVPIVKSNDPRLQLLDKNDEEYNDFNDYEEKLTSDKENIKHLLKTKSKKELIQMLINASEMYPDITNDWHINSVSSPMTLDESLIKKIHKQIEYVSSEDCWWDGWNRSGHIADYSYIKKGLTKLLNAGYSDEVLKLGEFLFKKGTEQVGRSNDDGATAMEIENCLKVVFQALSACSMPDVDKMEKAINFSLNDQYWLCSDIDLFWEKTFDQSSWSALADRLLKRLQDMPLPKNSEQFHDKFTRDRLVDYIMEALQNAGREKEIIPLCMTEAENTDNYPRIVRLFIEAGRTKEAETWIRKGYNATQDRLPGIASALIHEMEKIKLKSKDWAYVAAIKAERFFLDPSLSCFKEIEKPARKAGCWTEVRKASIHFLESGTWPDAWDDSVKNKKWPLPVTGLMKPGKKYYWSFPRYDILIEIAIHEKNVKEIIHWYELYTSKNTWGWNDENLHDSVATAVMNHYPDKSITIWKQIAEIHIKKTGKKEYRTAAIYLKKIKSLLKRQKKTNEWKQYIQSLRETNKRKPRLIETLDELESKPIYRSI